MNNLNAGSVNFLNNLRQDNVFVTNEVVDLKKLTGIEGRQGLDKAIISNGKLVNVVSNNFGHLPNEVFFKEFENKLTDANINYVTQSINKADRSFAVDYILNDDSYAVTIKNGTDKIKPMIRAVNPYDGSGPTTGYLGFFREICTNGLHVSVANISFKVRHNKGNTEVVIENIAEIVKKFMDNEFYSINRKFEVLAERPIEDLSKFVKFIAGEASLFKYEKSEKNPEPSKNAQLVIDTINREANILGTSPNLWLGYNAFNEWIHGREKRTFANQKDMDGRLFRTVYKMAEN